MEKEERRKRRERKWTRLGCLLDICGWAIFWGAEALAQRRRRRRKKRRKKERRKKKIRKKKEEELALFFKTWFWRLRAWIESSIRLGRLAGSCCWSPARLVDGLLVRWRGIICCDQHQEQRRRTKELWRVDRRQHSRKWGRFAVVCLWSRCCVMGSLD